MTVARAGWSPAGADVRGECVAMDAAGEGRAGPDRDDRITGQCGGGHGMAKKAVNLTRAQIWRWARAHYDRWGKWPGRDTGPVTDGPDITWSTVDRCLKKGGHGLRAGSSLSELIKDYGGLQNLRRAKPGLTRKQVLDWADLHHERMGKWPDRDSGPVIGGGGISWGTIDKRLRYGGLNLPGGMTLTRLLREARGVWDRRGKPRLTIKRILKWSDAHYNLHGRWPVTLSGPVHGAPGEDWAAVDMALRDGRRGLPGGSSLARVLDNHRGVPSGKGRACLTVSEIAEWAKQHQKRTGRWPTRKSGAVHGAPAENWGAIDSALRTGSRGLRGDSSLAKLRERFGQ